MPYTNLTDFKARNNITVATYDGTISWYIDSLDNWLTREVGALFTLTNSTQKYWGTHGGESFIQVGAWQSSGLTIKRGQQNSTTPSDLILNKDYYLVKVPNETEPVYGIRLACPLADFEFIEVSGNKGWSADIPFDLQVAMDGMITSQIQKVISSSQGINSGNAAAGYTTIQTEESSISHTVKSVVVKTTADQQQSQNQSANPFDTSNISNILERYREYTIKLTSSN